MTANSVAERKNPATHAIDKSIALTVANVTPNKRSKISLRSQLENRSRLFLKARKHYSLGIILALLTYWITSYKLTAFELSFARFRMGTK